VSAPEFIALANSTFDKIVKVLEMRENDVPAHIK